MSQGPSVVGTETDKSVGVRIRTEYGTVEGFVHQTAEENVTGNVFLGVPFAAPPVGDLRFEKPVPPEKWDTVIPTKDFRNSCVPYVKSWIQNPTFSEDCLYLNIMTPHEPSEDPRGYPVLAYIHGGGYCFGDVVKFGYDKATRNFVSRGIVVVTIPYRVGIYGFFTTGTKEDGGNLGFWDQLMALKFIKNNIKEFGGDPDNITLWGQSAGAGSVAALALSPHSRDLFHKIYQSSGSIFNSWGIGSPVINSTLNLAKALGCESKDPSEIKAFMKKAKWEDILEISSTKFKTELNVDKGDENSIKFGPRLDEDFFDGKTLEELLDEAPPKPTLMGLMSQEGGPFVLMGLAEEKIKNFSTKNIEEYVEKFLCPRTQAKDEADSIKKDLLEFYSTPDKDPISLLKMNSDLASDVTFVQSVINETEMKIKKNWKIYFYIWDYIDEKYSKMFPIKGAFHVYELLYLSDQKTFVSLEQNDEIKKITKMFSEMVSNFVKTGNPSSESIDFPAYDLEKRKILWFDLESEIREDPWKKRRLFWTELIKKYDFDLLRGMNQEQIKKRISW